VVKVAVEVVQYENAVEDEPRAEELLDHTDSPVPSEEAGAVDVDVDSASDEEVETARSEVRLDDDSMTEEELLVQADS
jgi:hypothetical protein